MGVTLRHFVVLGLLAFAVTYLCVPLARRLALRLDAVDYPSARRVNKRPVPRMGGIAMAAGIAVALLVEVAGEFFLGWAGFYVHGDNTVNHPGVMVGLLVIVLVGALDDVYSLKPSVKLAGQILGATIIAGSGLLLSSIANPVGPGYIEFGWFAYPLTVLYLVCFMNVINLIDGLDGLAAGISTIASFFLFIIAFGRGMEETAMLSIILLGVTLAFLRYNFTPASIFMGDSGSLLLGAMIGVISLMGVMRSPTVIVLAVPLVIAAIPIADTAAAIARRLYHHRPIQQADRKHLHHLLLSRGLGVRRSVLIVYAWTALLGLGAWVMSSSHGIVVWIVIVVLLIGSFLILWKLGIFDQVLRHHYHGRHTRQEDKPRWYGQHGR
ncbi:MraY family glycosyltransferase [Adlercreutzia equolifaciens]|uniref:MraY family glycosyltransferase n=1 Tax=Adlercreutzia equolifaciens TaxID=446660 RepID=UPI000A068D7A|nr:MraY family glycosyltransferase [Adlercreutzia equolifaciens]RFT84210.1 undecaprenyl/decaprenyl-phosphate alpha-N-acetylglucosaminyl 1-phosphate transferase [Adlercreutzia equolifaciens]HJI12239.1 undecaprenyl/decaprenyl-phosphate alpha-N-acetylglucosaminyl 1-phosphate transferase [Adlercreutzia equolifaciens]